MPSACCLRGRGNGRPVQPSATTLGSWPRGRRGGARRSGGLGRRLGSRRWRGPKRGGNSRRGKGGGGGGGWLGGGVGVEPMAVPEAWVNLAAAMERQGRVGEGIDVLARAVAAMPDEAGLYIGRAQLLQRVNRIADMERDARRA